MTKRQKYGNTNAARTASLYGDQSKSKQQQKQKQKCWELKMSSRATPL